MFFLYLHCLHILQRHGVSGVRLTRDSKLPVGVSARVNGCLSLLALQQAGDLS